MKIMSVAKQLTGANVEELEIIRRAIYIAGRQSLQAKPSNKDEWKEQFIKNGGYVEQINNLIFFKHIETIDGFTGEMIINHYCFLKTLV